MPGIFELTCTQCSFVERTSESSTWVTLRDGRQEVCGPPCERRTAEELTGQPWAALVREGRLLYRYAFVCLGCGDVDHYEPPRKVRGGHIAAIVHHPGADDGAKLRCVKCGQARLSPVQGAPASLGIAVALALAVMATFGAIAACGKCAIDLAIDGDRSAFRWVGLFVGAASVGALVTWMAVRRHARRATEAAPACPRCGRGALRCTMVATS